MLLHAGVSGRDGTADLMCPAAGSDSQIRAGNSGGMKRWGSSAESGSGEGPPGAGNSDADGSLGHERKKSIADEEGAANSDPQWDGDEMQDGWFRKAAATKRGVKAERRMSRERSLQDG